MESVEFWDLFIVLVGLAFVTGVFGARRYGYVINPLILFSMFDIGVLTLLSVFVANQLNDDIDAGLVSVLYLTIVYLLGFLFAFSFRRFVLPRQLFNALFRIVGARSGYVGHSSVNQFILIAAAVSIFLVLMQASGAG